MSNNLHTFATVVVLSTRNNIPFNPYHHSVYVEERIAEKIAMEQITYFHLCADGNDASNFIVSNEDFVAAFNIIGVCAANCLRVSILCFSLEDTHPHFLLRGTYSDCLAFKDMFTTCYEKYAAHRKPSPGPLTLDIQMYGITDINYLRNVGTYVICQATKDGKHVMPYDYRYGTGSLYFRTAKCRPIWCYDDDGEYSAPIKAADLKVHQRMSELHSKKSIPDEWLMANGFLLPQNYIDIKGFESIYSTHNCFRVFLSGGRNRETEILAKMAENRGIAMEDLEARQCCSALSIRMFGLRDVRRLNTRQRLSLALELRSKYHLTVRQIALLSRLPRTEVEKHIR